MADEGGGFIAFQTEVYSDNIQSEEDITAGVLIEEGTFLQRSCMGTVAFTAASFLEPYRGPKVRRPVQGTQIKQERHAYLYVMDSSGQEILVYNSVGSTERDSQGARRKLKDKYWTDFILTQVQESRMEKAQIIETFGESFVYFFGERTRTLQFQALLFNTHDFNWRTEFWLNYDEHLRGTKCVEKKARVYISWDDVLVEGYLLQAAAVENANSPYVINLEFTLLVTNYVSLGGMMNSIWESMIARAEQYADKVTIPSEFVGSLEDDVKSLTTGEAILVSQSLQEWMDSAPAQGPTISIDIDVVFNQARRFVKDPWGTTKEFIKNPQAALELPGGVNTNNFLPNDLCKWMAEAEDFISEATGRWNAVMEAADVISDPSRLSEPGNIAKMVGGARAIGETAGDAYRVLNSFEEY